MRRTIIRISDTCIICVIIFFYAFIGISCSSKTNTGNLIFINNSTELIKHASITICEQDFEFNNIQPHEKLYGTFKVTSDSHYKVIVLFASGKIIRDELGYVTHGFDFGHIMSVTDASISLSSTEIL